jgi:hypothetical protein
MVGWPLDDESEKFWEEAMNLEVLGGSDESERFWEEAIVACSKYLPGVSMEEYVRTRDNRCPYRDSFRRYIWFC